MPALGQAAPHALGLACCSGSWEPSAVPPGRDRWKHPPCLIRYWSIDEAQWLDNMLHTFLTMTYSKKCFPRQPSNIHMYVHNIQMYLILHENFHKTIITNCKQYTQSLVQIYVQGWSQSLNLLPDPLWKNTSSMGHFTKGLFLAIWATVSPCEEVNTRPALLKRGCQPGPCTCFDRLLPPVTV